MRFGRDDSDTQRNATSHHQNRLCKQSEFVATTCIIGRGEDLKVFTTRLFESDSLQLFTTTPKTKKIVRTESYEKLRV